MLTKKDSIAVGKALTAGAVQEVYNCFSRPDETFAIKGATHRMLQNLWYDVLPARTKEAFGWDCQKFINEVWK